MNGSCGKRAAGGGAGLLAMVLVMAVVCAPAAAYASDLEGVVPGGGPGEGLGGGFGEGLGQASRCSFWIGIAGTVVVFAGDGSVRDVLAEPGSDETALAVASAVSLLGDGAVDLALCGLLAAHDPELGYAGANSVILAGGTCAILKALTGRARPWVTGADEDTFRGPTLEAGYDSFPSGHSATAFALARVLALRYPSYRWWLYSLASLVGLSRLVTGQHWASDVVAGALLGVWAADRVMSRPGAGLLEILRW